MLRANINEVENKDTIGGINKNECLFKKSNEICSQDDKM